MLSSSSNKEKSVSDNFSKSNHVNSGSILPAFSPRANLKPTLELVKRVKTNLDSSKSDPDYIPVVVLKICESELSFVLAELFNMCLKESFFQDSWKISSMVALFKNVGKRSVVKK